MYTLYELLIFTRNKRFSKYNQIVRHLFKKIDIIGILGGRNMDDIKYMRYTPDIANGLTNAQIEERMSNHLFNEEMGQITKSYKEILRDNIFTLFNLINAVLAGLIIFIGSYRNLLFLGVVISNIVIGIFQEIRAKRVLDKLSLITQTDMKVIRNGKTQAVHIHSLVLDDIMILDTGNQVCIDAIVKEGMLEVNESLVNGESDIITKKAGDFLYSGSFVVSGHALVQVEKVGKHTYAQTIMSDAKVLKRHDSQLRDSINWIIKIISSVIIPLGILLFFKQYAFQDYSFSESIVATVAALLGMIPEGLVLLTSVALAVGSIRLAKHKTLVQELYCIETLARVDTLCLDKTGTITEGNMRVEDIISFDHKDYSSIIANVSYAIMDENSTAYAIRAYLEEETSMIPDTILPFSSARKFSAVTFQKEGTYILGAYSFVCKEKDKVIEKQVEHYANSGNRVLVLAHSNLPIKEKTIPSDAVALAMIILSDPIRKEAPDTLAYFHSQGVDIKIISGDDPATVHEIARKANVLHSDAWIDASTIKDEDMEDAVKKYTVFGRVTPHQKKLMIKCLKESGHTTAMVGDGVNDVMALKEANCSIAMASGSEAAKNVANLVLLDSDFVHVPQIVAEGRRVINNIQRAASLYLVKTTFSTLLSVLTLFLNAKYPFAPIQLTLISTCTIGIPSFFLALETNHSRVQGNFLFNVFSKALPGALVVLCSVVYVTILKDVLHFSSDVRTTMIVIMTGISGLVVLKRVCTPFSKERFIIFTAMTALFTISVVLGGQIFLLVRLTVIQFGCLAIGCISIPFLMDILHRIGSHMDFIKKKLLKV